MSSDNLILNPQLPPNVDSITLRRFYYLNNPIHLNFALQNPNQNQTIILTIYLLPNEEEENPTNANNKYTNYKSRDSIPLFVTYDMVGIPTTEQLLSTPLSVVVNGTITIHS